MFVAFNVQQNIFANLLVTRHIQRSKEYKQFDRLFDPRNADVDGVAKTVVLAGNHHLNLLGRNALEIRHRLDLRKPVPLGRVLAVKTVDAILRCTLLSQHGLLRTLDHKVAARIHGTLAGQIGGDVAVLRQHTNRRLQHDRHLTDVDLGNHPIDDGRGVHFFRVADDVLNVQINHHCGGVGEIAQLRLLGQHEFGRTVVFVNLWRVQLEIFKRNKDFQEIFVVFGHIIVFGTNHHRIEHLDGPQNLKINEMIVGFDLVPHQTIQMLTTKIGIDQDIRFLDVFTQMTQNCLFGFIDNRLHFFHVIDRFFNCA